MLPTLLAAPALAAWSTSGSGAAGGAATKMPSGNVPTANASGSSVTVSWPTAKFVDGTPVAGYVVKRYDAASGAAATVGAGCSGTVTATSCSEQSVPAGSWAYTDTPVLDNWTGSESASSQPVTVQVLGSAPTNTAEPVVSGTVATGEVLSTTNGSWANGPASYGYQWQDCASDGSSCSNITLGSGCSTTAFSCSSSYTVQAGDAGHTIEAEVRASNASGSATAGAPIVPLVDNFGGSSVDTNVWGVLNQQGDTSNNETECYVTGQVAEGSNALTETAVVDGRPAPPASGQCPSGTPGATATAWDTGAVQERATAFTYGTVVVRASLAGPGSAMWPAIWLLGASCQSSSTAPYTFLSGTSGTNTGFYCPWDSDAADAAEIDIAEGYGGSLNEQLHSNGSNAPQCQPPISYANTTHTYELDWSAGSLVWKVDGTTECSTTTNVPSHPMFLIIDSAVCSSTSSCGGSPVNGDFPATTTVYYVHVSH
jgi:hypothetical protein